ncbi:MAG: c-type cytochrome [Gemmatimonadaceae bacterium]
MSHVRRPLILLAATMLPAFAFASESVTRAPRRARTTWDSVYTAEQAGRGETTYAKTCSRCHQAALGGADEAPALTGSAFMGSWNGQTLQSLHDRVRTTMPTDTPGTYSRQDIADVLAYMLKFNQFPAGSVELPSGDEELKAIMFVSTKP